MATYLGLDLSTQQVCFAMCLCFENIQYVKTMNDVNAQFKQYPRARAEENILYVIS